MCTNISVRLFGKISIQRGNGTQVIIEAKKAMELFGYLLMYRNKPHTREALAEANWGDNSSARSKKYLRQALWQIQSALDPQLDADCASFLLTDSEWVQINSAAPLWLDVAEFEQIYALTQKKNPNELAFEDYDDLKKAANLYQGDLLEGWYGDWCLYERERLQNMCLSMLDKLMAYCEVHNQYEEALEFGNNILRMDVAHERTHRRMVRIYYKSGERTTALRQYERCVTALRDELGVKPSHKTVELYERICRDQPPVHLPHLDPITPATSNEMLLRRLTRLKKMVATFQQQVLSEINVIETVLNENDSKPMVTNFETASRHKKTL